ncbi:hypothetical protein [Listeria newyorkensis]|uniref:hypothetical protein n=1 Tax=Listeria newyorkensis TaxID=1497681 RepID=UPI00051DE5E1|nr:hypothetical protein [Listeria newyorkensis]KGL44088.1 hypothetical protein EP58_06460 [Listeria newyorkensis]SQC57444.1 Uncharacterised protein [Listeria newyorkensis]
MDYSKIVFVLELNDDSADNSTNSYLEKGWLLISVGPKLTDITNSQAYYSTSYVVGATREQYDEYLKDQKGLLDRLTGI